ncbi:MAG: acylphosphatase [Sphingobacteriales bacterium]|nr:acylphosphatase [Sphingobacteriales bacterium]
MKTLRIIVSGRVQGVFFRASTKAVADQIGIKGIVKNLPDGTVFIEAEGEDFLMEDFLDWCKYGPDDARVDDISIEEIETKNYRNFNILKK